MRSFIHSVNLFWVPSLHQALYLGLENENIWGTHPLSFILVHAVRMENKIASVQNLTLWVGLEESGKAFQSSSWDLKEVEFVKQTNREKPSQADVKAQRVGNSVLITGVYDVERTPEDEVSRERTKSQRTLCMPHAEALRVYPVITWSLWNTPAPLSIYCVPCAVLIHCDTVCLVRGNQT